MIRFSKKILNFVQKYINILSSDDKEKLINIHMRLEHVENLIINYNQNNMNESQHTVEEEEHDDLDGRRTYWMCLQQKLIYQHDAKQIMNSYHHL